MLRFWLKSVLFLIIITNSLIVYPQGLNWVKQTDKFTRAFTLVDDSVYAIYTNSGLFKSFDKGLTWDSIPNNLIQGQPSFFSNGINGNYFVGFSSATTPGIYKSNDSLKNWQLVSPVIECYSMVSDSNAIIFSGTKNGVIKSTNNGNSWTTVLTGTINEVIISNDNSLFVVSNYKILKSTNSGGSFQDITPQNEEITSAFYSKSNNRLYIYEGNAAINPSMYFTTNNGVTWTEIQNQNTGSLNVSVGYYPIQGNIIFRVITNFHSLSTEFHYSNDGLNSWVNVNSIPFNVYSLSFLKTDNSGHIVLGLLNAPGMYKSNSPYTSLISMEEKIVLIDYRLEQNYPNPFNPNTVINYSIPVSGNVKLEVYNSLGERVMELVNQYQDAGSHYVVMNASGLTSGVYFYKLSSGSFSQSKKMIVLK